ncbi:hypothetical protein Tco_1084415 [Tanacetum coccineum]
MQELREDTYSGNKNEDAHDHVDRVLNIVSFVNIPGVSQDAILLPVFPFTLTGSAKRWTAKRLEDIHNFKQESNESLYQAWEWYKDLLYKCPTHDINNHQKVNIFHKGLSTMNRQLLDSHGPIPRMTSTQAMTAIQTMADYSQKWHDGTLSRNISSSNNADGLGAIVSKLDNLGRDMKKLKENVHLEEVKYGEFMRSAPFNRSNRAKFRVEAQIEQLTKELHSRTTNVTPSSSTEKCKVVNDDHETQHRPISSRKLNNKEGWMTKDIQCQLPPEELNLDNFTLPCTIGNFNFYGMADLGASVNVMPRNIFEYLKLANLRNTNMLVEMADMTKKAPLGIIENILVRIEKFLFPSNFVIIDKTPNETIILGRPFLSTIHAEIDVFDKEISLETDNDRVSYDMEKRIIIS